MGFRMCLVQRFVLIVLERVTLGVYCNMMGHDRNEQTCVMGTWLKNNARASENTYTIPMPSAIYGSTTSTDLCRTHMSSATANKPSHFTVYE